MSTTILAPQPVPLNRLVHKLRNPLCALQLMAEDLRLGGSPDDNLAAHLASQTHSLSQMLSAAILAEEATPRRMTTVDVRCLIEGAIALVADELASPSQCHGPDLAIDCHASGRVLCRGDSGLLALLFEHLVRNAAESGSNRVEVQIGEDATHALITIRDWGQGLPDGFAAEPFVPFTSSKKGHLGLGLSICARVAFIHGGQVALGPAPLGGTLASVRLPKPGTQTSAALRVCPDVVQPAANTLQVQGGLQ